MAAFDWIVKNISHLSSFAIVMLFQVILRKDVLASSS